MTAIVWIPRCPRCGATNYQPLGGGVRLCLPCGQAWQQSGPADPADALSDAQVEALAAAVTREATVAAAE